MLRLSELTFTGVKRVTSLLTILFYHFLKEHVCGVHQERDHSKYSISVFRDIVGYIKCFRQHVFCWYQRNIVNW